MNIYVFNEALLLLGGITVFLLGLNGLTEGMQGLLSKRVRRILGKCSDNPLAGVAAGAGITAIAQSGVAVNVVAISFVEKGALTFYGACAVIMGANIGTTVTAQIMSLSGGGFFNITAFGSLAAFAGFLTRVSAKSERLKGVGGVFVGFGLIFIGLEITSDSVACFKGYEWFRNIFLIDCPAILFLNGIVVTAIMQSSSAVTGIMIVLAGSGLLSFDHSVFIILGANVGSCIPVILSALNKGGAARNAAFFNLQFNLFGAAVFTVPMLVFGKGFSALFINGKSAAQAIADFHTVFNIVVTAIVLPFLKPVASRVKNLRKKEKERHSFALKG
ncbi:MAG: Na/Pi cotransporter family protein [Clostridia bacterium]|nr:Na/Pi cotransporter family protein [Clostridia bacterium]